MLLRKAIIGLERGEKETFHPWFICECIPDPGLKEAAEAGE